MFVRKLTAALVFSSVALLTACDSGSVRDAPVAASPNILFIVLDDLGVDQLSVFGYGGLTAPKTPVIDTIAAAGVRFRNTWSMPTCSPGRATYFQGRYPFRTHVSNAIVANDLANSQVSPFEYTLPKVLKEKGYVSAVIGKMHLSGSDLNPANNPLGNGVMHTLGWDYFEGYLDGGPFPIDTTAGGVAPEGTYSCGFVPNTRNDAVNGADGGACYLANSTCQALTTADHPTPGRLCLERGGLFDPRQSCQANQPAYLNFDTQNAYYTGEWIINHPDGRVQKLPASNPENRAYRSTLETDRALAWIKRQTDGRPWMLSLGYSAIHTPLQPPPASLLPTDAINTDGFDCEDNAQFRVMTNQMIEAMDKEIGRLLVEAGIAARGSDGSVQYDPSASNTMVVIVGDNGTYAPSVKAPFNPTRAKGFPYQTGVWVPLIVAGPLVNQANRDVEHMVNSADLYRLFSELAGIELDNVVPAYRQLDAQPVLPYLTAANSGPIRASNYTEVGTNIKATTAEPAPPCVIPASNVCVQLFPQKAVCEDQGGTWYGPGGAAGAGGLASCCAVNDYLTTNNQATVNLFPETQRALRNENYKLVRLERLNCSTGKIEATDEFYRIDQARTLPKLDNAVSDLLALNAMTTEARQNYTDLSNQLYQLLTTEVDCAGDGNIDGVVDQKDLDDWAYYSQLNGGRSSWYDFNYDGLTDDADRRVIEQNLGRNCRPGAA